MALEAFLERPGAERRCDLPRLDGTRVAEVWAWRGVVWPPVLTGIDFI